MPVVVHFLVVILIFPGNNGLPPFPVVQIPLDGLLDAVGEFGLGEPAQFVVDLGGVDSVIVS